MSHVAVAEYLPLAASLANAFDHRIVVERVGKNEAIGNELGNGGNAGLVRHIARGEEQRAFLAVQIGEFVLELHQGMVGACDVAGAAGAGADSGRGLDHRANHLRMLAHAEVIVGAPDDDVARTFRRMPHRVGETAGDAFQIGENPIPSLIMEAGEGGTKKLAVIHRGTWNWHGAEG